MTNQDVDVGRRPFEWLISQRTWVKACHIVRYFAYDDEVLCAVRTQRNTMFRTEPDMVVMTKPEAERIQKRVSGDPPPIWAQEEAQRRAEEST